MASKIKDTHASWQNLFNRDAITPRLESKTKLSNLHTKNYSQNLHLFGNNSNDNIKKREFSSKYLYPKYYKDGLFTLAPSKFSKIADNSVLPWQPNMPKNSKSTRCI
jgi:hypothetical protein